MSEHETDQTANFSGMGDVSSSVDSPKLAPDQELSAPPPDDIKPEAPKAEAPRIEPRVDAPKAETPRETGKIMIMAPSRGKSWDGATVDHGPAATDNGQGSGRFGKRLIYGGHAISLARALSFNGLENAFHVAAINGGRHVNPLFAGGTVFAWSEILACAEVPGRGDIGALRVRTVATKDRPCADFPSKKPDGEYDEAVILDLDYWVVLPR